MTSWLYLENHYLQSLSKSVESEGVSKGFVIDLVLYKIIQVANIKTKLSFWKSKLCGICKHAWWYFPSTQHTWSIVFGDGLTSTKREMQLLESPGKGHKES